MITREEDLEQPLSPSGAMVGALALGALGVVAAIVLAFWLAAHFGVIA